MPLSPATPAGPALPRAGDGPYTRPVTMHDFIDFLVGTGEKRLGFWTGVACVAASGVLELTASLLVPYFPLTWLWIDLLLAAGVAATAWRRGYGRSFGMGLLAGAVAGLAVALPIAAVILLAAAMA